MDIVQRSLRNRAGSAGQSVSKDPHCSREKANIPREGYLICQQRDEIQHRGQVFFPRIVSPQFDPGIVKEWLTACQKYHWCTSQPWGRSEKVPDVNFIDCEARSIISGSSFPSIPRFVALSYVWGAKTTNKPAEEVSGVKSNGQLPKVLPAVIEDAIKVTQALGFRYIWVDKYCIDQSDNAEKHRQIFHMDCVYSNAALTIIAAAGNDEETGLPGVSTHRPSRQISIQTKSLHIVSTLPHPQQQIVESRWATRAWTYQEAILSPRRLVFTADQLYFECDHMHCYESLGVSFDLLYRSRVAACRDFVKPRLFGLENFAGEVLYVECAEAYARRSLTYDDDALSAFFGVVRRLEKVSAPPVRHVAGVPFFHPGDVDRWGDIDYFAMLMIGFSWRHDGGRAGPRRREKFPSWSWVGWAGPVVWPSRGACRCFWHYRYSEVRRDPAGDVAPRRGAVRLELDDGTTHSIWDLPYDSDDDLAVRRPRALILDTMAISRDEVVLDETTGAIQLRSGGELEFFPSQEGLSPFQAVDGLKCGRYEGILLAVVDDDSHILLVEQCGSSHSRIGIMRTKKPPSPIWQGSGGLRTFKLI